MGWHDDYGHESTHASRMQTLHEISEAKREAAELAEMREAHDWPLWKHEQAAWWDDGCPA